MTADATPDDEPEVSAQGEAGGEAGGEAAAPAAGELDALRKERDELFDRLARVSAEFQNFQKRVQRDRAKWTQDAVRDVLSGLLSVFDAIDLAAGSIERGADPQAVKQGVEMVREELRRQLGHQGVSAMDVAKGTPFDPERHQAIAVEEVAGLAREEVSFVARAGYTIGDLVLRPAQVGVRKPAPSPPPQPVPEQA
ncbi:MAG: nucleotide exchange factor GrpE [Planctomycetes bacterium]|nr:nucleotide exchange factor GrpE [Planctomycetota bacterium]